MDIRQVIENRFKNKLKSKAGDVIFQRGANYSQRGLVFGMNIDGENKASAKAIVSGNVSGTKNYEVSFNFDFKNKVFSEESCNCPYQNLCKHVVAICLEFISTYCDFIESHNNEIIKDGINEKIIFIKWIHNIQGISLEGDDFETRDDVLYGKADIAGVDTEFLSQLQSIGVNIDNLPNVVLRKLAASLNPSTVEQGEYDIVDSKKVNSRPFDEGYEIVISVSYKFDCKIREKDNPSYFMFNNTYNRQSLDQLIVDEEKNITTEQKKLLHFLSKTDFWYNNVDFEILLTLIDESKLNIVLDSGKDEEEKISILLKPKQKLGASLVARERESFVELEDAEKDRIVHFDFELDKKYFQDSDLKLVSGKNSLILIQKNKIILYKSTQLVINIINRIFEERRYYRDIFGIELEEKEIFNLNNLVDDLRKIFVLKGGLKSDFKIKKFTKAQKSFLVNYNMESSRLSIYSVMDYEFYKVPVSQSVYLRRGRNVGYKRKEFRNSQKYISKVDLKQKTIYYAKIRPRKEIELYKEIIENYSKLGFTKTGICNINGDKKIWQYYQNFWESVEAFEYPIYFLQDKFEFEKEDFKANVNVDFDDKRDWLAFDVDCYCGQNKITLETLRNYIENKDEFIKTKDGKLLKITNKEELEKFVLMLESFHQQKQGGKFEGKIYHAPELDDIFTNSDYYDAKLDKGFSKFMKEAQSGRPVEKIELSTNFKKIMRDYQIEGIDWFYFLRKYHFAGILADDMGLGKTLQALILMEMSKDKNEPSVVICPKTLLYNWQLEAKKFLPKMKSIVIDGHPEERKEKIGKVKQNELIITSYPTLQKDLEYYKKQKIKFNYCILDEAQMIKNHRTKNARTVKQIDAKYRLALTGTPLENTVEEIWSIFDFLMPGFLGSHKAFSQKFLKPIMKEGNAQSLKSLHKKTSCFMLRRSKEEVLKELPPKIEKVVQCKLKDSQNILYQEILANVKSDIFNTVQQKGFAKSQIHILAGLTKLRQVCNHPVLLLKDKKYTEYDSAKLESFNELVGEIVASGRKVLVFSQFTKMLDILNAELKKNKIDALYLSGQTKNRQQVIDEFNEKSKKQIFLISLKAGGVGLNLTAADNVIIFDPWWNPSVENQAVDRAHRFGQTKSVNVYRLITKGTIEEKIVELQQKKQHLFDNLVGESKDMFKKLTWDDVQDLFK